jgi:uncharacterized protein (DUF924 family)
MSAVINPAVIYEPVLQFWFGSGSNALEIAKTQANLWWGKSPTTDADIRERFGALRERAITGELESWEQTSRGRLALIILVDQLSRNIFRDRPEAFTYDYAAQEWCLTGLDLGADEELQPIERVFFYLPLQHSESRVDQSRSVALLTVLVTQVPKAQHELFADYLEFAKKHQVIIERFGRFPHRNRALGRTSTIEEVEFLKGPDSSF